MRKKELYKRQHSLDLKTVIALNRTTNEINRRANAIFYKHGLSNKQFAVLEVLYHKGNLRVGEIIKKILSTGGNMTVVINNLEKDGMIQKKTDPSDNRSSIISITEKGCRKIEDVFPDYLDDLCGRMEQLSVDEKCTLVDILRKLSI